MTEAVKNLAVGTRVQWDGVDGVIVAHRVGYSIIQTFEPSDVGYQAQTFNLNAATYGVNSVDKSFRSVSSTSQVTVADPKLQFGTVGQACTIRHRATGIRMTGRIVGSLSKIPYTLARLGIFVPDSGDIPSTVCCFQLADNDPYLVPRYRHLRQMKAIDLHGWEIVDLAEEVKAQAEAAGYDIATALKNASDLSTNLQKNPLTKDEKNMTEKDTFMKTASDAKPTRVGKAVQRLKKSKDKVPFRVARMRALTDGKKALIGACKKALPENVSSVIEAVLETEAGAGFVLAGIGVVGPMAPKYGDHPYMEAMCNEFVEEGMALGANQVLSLLGALLEPALKSALESLPPIAETVQEKVKPKRKQRVAVPKNVIPMKSTASVQDEPEEEVVTSAKRSASI